MGEKSKYQNSRPRLEEVSEDEEVRIKDRGHLVSLINMSLQELWDVAYQQGFEDGMSFIEDPKIAHG